MINSIKKLIFTILVIIFFLVIFVLLNDLKKEFFQNNDNEEDLFAKKMKQMNVLKKYIEAVDDVISDKDSLININKRIKLHLIKKKEEEELLKKIEYKENKSKNMDVFDDENELIKKKILEFKYSQKNTEYAENIFILKNLQSNLELMLKRNKGNKDLFKLKINKLYLNVNNRFDYSVKEYENDLSFLFYLKLVENNKEYNKLIRSSGNDGEQVFDDSVKYPFYIIVPYYIPNFAVHYAKDSKNNKKLSIRPITNNKFQQFKRIYEPTSD